MATVSLWKVDNRLDHVINYAANIEKTSLKDKEDLKDVLDYATRSSKTEKKLFVNALNCTPCRVNRSACGLFVSTDLEVILLAALELAL